MRGERGGGEGRGRRDDERGGGEGRSRQDDERGGGRGRRDDERGEGRGRRDDERGGEGERGTIPQYTFKLYSELLKYVCTQS